MLSCIFTAYYCSTTELWPCQSLWWLGWCKPQKFVFVSWAPKSYLTTWGQECPATWFTSAQWESWGHRAGHFILKGFGSLFNMSCDLCVFKYNFFTNDPWSNLIIWTYARPRLANLERWENSWWFNLFFGYKCWCSVMVPRVQPG